MREVSASFLGTSDVKKTIARLNYSNCDYIHFDVMDGRFVESKFLTVKELTDLIKLSQKKIDVHLMVNDPLKYIEKLVFYNISYLTIHYEIKDCLKYIDMIKASGIKVGISLKPETAIDKVFPLLDKLDLVLIMGVEPGKSGQKFMKETSKRIDILKEEIERRKLKTKVSVDGGINEEILNKVFNADILVSSSYILKDLDRINILKGIND